MDIREFTTRIMTDESGRIERWLNAAFPPEWSGEEIIKLLGIDEWSRATEKWEFEHGIALFVNSYKPDILTPEEVDYYDAEPIDEFWIKEFENMPDKEKWKMAEKTSDEKTLIFLSHSPDEIVRENVAKNPATPGITVERMCKDKFEPVRCLIANRKDAKFDNLYTLSKDESEFVRKYVAENENTTPELLDALSNDEEPRVRKAVADNPNTPDETLEKLKNDENAVVKRSAKEAIRFKINKEAAEYKETRLELEILADNEDDRIRRKVAIHPNASEELLDKLAYDKEEYVRGNVALKKTSLKTLYRLSDDEYPGVRRIIARNERMPEKILIKLLNDEEWFVRKEVFTNPSFPKELLEIFSRSDNEQQRVLAAGSPLAGYSMVESLSTDKSVWVREAVSENLNTPWSILIQLTDDEEKRVKDIAEEYLVKRTLKYLKDCNIDGDDGCPYGVKPRLLEIAESRDTSLPLFVNLAINSATPKDILDILAKNYHWGVRLEVARNSNTSPKTLAKLAKTAELDDVAVTQAVAENPNTPVEALICLTNYENETIKKIAEEAFVKRALNSEIYEANGPVEEKLIGIASDKHTSKEILRQLAGCDYSYVRDEVSLNPAAPGDVLIALGKDADFGVRANATFNKNTPADTLIDLSDDENDIVLQNVAINPNTPLRYWKSWRMKMCRKSAGG